jgi:hypothetical protein
MLSNIGICIRLQKLENIPDVPLIHTFPESPVENTMKNPGRIPLSVFFLSGDISPWKSIIHFLPDVGRREPQGKMKGGDAISSITALTGLCRGSWRSVRQTEQNEQCLGHPRTV